LFSKPFFDVASRKVTRYHGRGMANRGLIPVFAGYSTFLQRGFDMLIMTWHLNLHVVFAWIVPVLVGRM
jgi:deoxyxylulose-5-phosphate synthase